MSGAEAARVIRPLVAEDLTRVMEIDFAIGGRQRRRFFEKRVEAALAEPKAFIYIGCETAGKLNGFLQARLLEGEFGGTEPVAILDNIGVDPQTRKGGIGGAMMQEFEAILRHKRISEIRTQADWRNESMLAFMARAGFLLAPRQLLEREVSYVDTGVEQEDEFTTDAEYREKDYSDPSSDEPGALARDVVCCRSLERDDLASLISIDKRVTGRERRAYYERKLGEALADTGIRVSLVGEVDRQVVGFIMARVDLGEFDSIEPVATLDTIAVNPGFTRQMVGAAMLSQLLGNLATLRLETIRTEVDVDHFDVLKFLLKNGFHTSQELALSRMLH